MLILLSFLFHALLCKPNMGYMIWCRQYINQDAKLTGWGALQKLSGLWSIYYGALNQLLSIFVFSCVELALNTLQNEPAHFMYNLKAFNFLIKSMERWPGVRGSLWRYKAVVSSSIAFLILLNFFKFLLGNISCICIAWFRYLLNFKYNSKL